MWYDLKIEKKDIVFFLLLPGTCSFCFVLKVTDSSF